MPYFPKQVESAYHCRGCGGWYYPGNVRCCVVHAPGTCCHYGETPAPGPVMKNDGGRRESQWGWS